MVSAATPSERVHTPNQWQLVAQRAKITLKCGKCVGLGAVLKAKLVAVSKKMTQKAGDDFFLVFASSLAWHFCKAETLSKNL